MGGRRLQLNGELFQLYSADARLERLQATTVHCDDNQVQATRFTAYMSPLTHEDLGHRAPVDVRESASRAHTRDDHLPCQRVWPDCGI
jgi:hypothetical protein